ncbi:MAG: hypothetical protein EA362_01920 [Saprospirales bacterium]|nr:MAG: hypothetical protein EA362_01920 [Saprospirales bacterium]
MKRKINDLKDLKIARLEAKLKAAESLRLAKEAGTDIKEDFSGIVAIGKTVKKFISPSKSVANKGNDNSSNYNAVGLDNFWNELGLDMLVQFRKKGVKWQSVIIPIGIWLIKNGYLQHIATTKKSEIYTILLNAVRKARSKMK